MSTSVPAKAIATTVGASAPDKASSDHDLARTSTLRFALGVTACVAIAFAYRWPLFYLAPVLAAFFLSLPAPDAPLRQAGRMFVAVLIAFALGLVFSHFLLPYPLVYITLLGLALFRIYYWVNRGGTPILAAFSLVAIMILPMMSLNQGTLASGFLLSLNFLVSAGLAVLAFLLAHAIMPDPDGPSAGTTAERSTPGHFRPAAVAALKSTLVMLPITVLFLGANWANESYVLIFAAIVSLSPEASKGRKKGLSKLTANLIGAAATLVFYWLIVAVPAYEFFVTLMFLTTLIFGSAIFSGRTLAKYMPSACIVLLVLIGASMTEHVQFIDKPFMRIVFIGLAALYVVSTMTVLDRVFARSERL
jgi:hypothetical protein